MSHIQTAHANLFCWWFQYCNKGFKQPGSLNYHMKATHNLDIPLSQGLEERYLRLKTRSAMRNLAAMEGWTPRLEQEGGSSKSRYSPALPSALPSASCAGGSCQLCAVGLKSGFKKKEEEERSQLLRAGWTPLGKTRNFFAES